MPAAVQLHQDGTILAKSQCSDGEFFGRGYVCSEAKQTCHILNSLKKSNRQVLTR